MTHTPSNGAWTPGPWSLPHFADGKMSCRCGHVFGGNYFGSIATINFDNGKIPGEGGNDSPPLEEAKANAHLIVSAPEMFEALEKLSDAVFALNDVLNEMWGREDNEKFVAPLGARQIVKIMNAQNVAFARANDGRAALAKAKGEREGKDV